MRRYLKLNSFTLQPAHRGWYLLHMHPLDRSTLHPQDSDYTVQVRSCELYHKMSLSLQRKHIKTSILVKMLYISLSIFLIKPRSMMVTLPWWSMITLEAFKSLYTYPFECMYYSSSTNYKTYGFSKVIRFEEISTWIIISWM